MTEMIRDYTYLSGALLGAHVLDFELIPEFGIETLDLVNLPSGHSESQQAGIDGGFADWGAFEAGAIQASYTNEPVAFVEAGGDTFSGAGLLSGGALTVDGGYYSAGALQLAGSANIIVLAGSANIIVGTTIVDAGSLTLGDGISTLGSGSMIKNPDSIFKFYPSITPIFEVHDSESDGFFEITPTIYSGPVSRIYFEMVGGFGNEVISASTYSDFINGNAGDDAIDAKAGDDVIDGGSGSNFLTGGAGWDVFFLDGRGGHVTWSTVTDFTAGEEINLWGWQPGVSKMSWTDMAGAEGYQGLTMHADLDGNGSIDASLTLAGINTRPAVTELDGLLWLFG